MRETLTKPVKRLTGTIFFLLALAIALSLAIQRSFRHPSLVIPLSTPSILPIRTEIPQSLGGKYYFAGQPHPTPAFRDAILVLTNSGYVSGYCERMKNPAWVCYRLFRTDNLKAPPRPGSFLTDKRTASGVTSADYSGSGYDRGHMAPNFGIAVCYGREAQFETFLMSNIIPQRPNLNRQLWENIESREIRDYAVRFEAIWVTDGPVFGTNHRTLKSGVAIPEKCYKIIVREDSGRPLIMAFIIPQDVTGNESPETFLTCVENIERETGLNFFSELPDSLETELETKSARSMW